MDAFLVGPPGERIRIILLLGAVAVGGVNAKAAVKRFTARCDWVELERITSNHELMDVITRFSAISFRQPLGLPPLGKCG